MPDNPKLQRKIEYGCEEDAIFVFREVRELGLCYKLKKSLTR